MQNTSCDYVNGLLLVLPLPSHREQTIVSMKRSLLPFTAKFSLWKTERADELTWNTFNNNDYYY